MLSRESEVKLKVLAMKQKAYEAKMFIDHEVDCDCTFCWGLYKISKTLNSLEMEVNSHGYTLDDEADM